MCRIIYILYTPKSKRKISVMENSNPIRPNPLISLVVTGEEFEKLEKFSKKYGVSIAQITRGFLRIGIADEPELQKVVVLGSLQE